MELELPVMDVKKERRTTIVCVVMILLCACAGVWGLVQYFFYCGVC